MSPQTFRLDRLYFQFLQPRDIPPHFLVIFAARLRKQGFILYEWQESGNIRYIETDKLTSRENRDELFKLLEGVKNER